VIRCGCDAASLQYIGGGGISNVVAELVQQSFDLRVRKLNDLLLTLIGEATDAGEQDVSRPEQEGHG